MPFFIERNDITKMKVDAIVNAANNSLLGGGGVDGAIHRAAGRKLLEECRKLNGCETGEAKYTSAYRLPCKYVIHTVGPVWRGGGYGEEALLRSCYRSSLRIAGELGCESVAFPLISAGAYGYPIRAAIEAASSEITAFLQTNDMNVTLVFFDRGSFRLGSDVFSGITSYIDDNYYERHSDPNQVLTSRMKAALRRHGGHAAASANMAEDVCCSVPMNGPAAYPAPYPMPSEAPSEAAYAQEEREAFYGDSCQAVPMASQAHAALDKREEPSGSALSLEEALRRLDESFSQNLLHRIDASGMTDAECYKRANVDRKLFSKIRSDPAYKPSKPTAIAFAIALRLDIRDTADLLRRAGFALSNASKFDVIIEYFITHGIYDIYAVNEALFAFDQPLLGA